MSGVNLTFSLFGKDHTASKAIKGVGDSAEHSHGKLGKLGSGGKTAMLALAGGVGIAAAGTVVAGKALADMAKSAAEDEKQQKSLALTLKNTTGATDAQVASLEGWITKQGEAYGVADEQLRPALDRLSRSTKDVGESQSLASLAMDASAGTGKSLQSVAEALGKAHDGNAGALARLGIQTKDAEGKTLSFEQITKNMAGTFKGQAAEGAGTLEGKMGRLKLMFDEAKEAIGAKLLPALGDLATWVMDKVVPAVKQAAEKIMPKLREAFDAIKKAIDENRPGLEKLGDMLKVVGQFVLTKVVPAFIKFETFIWKNMIKAIGALGEILPPIVAAYLSGASKIVGGFKGMYTGVTGVLEGILTVAEKTMGWIPGIGDKIKDAKAGFSSFRDDTITKLGEVEAGLRTAAASVDAYSEKAKNVKKAELKADIADITAKVYTAKQELNNPDLTKDRKAELKANIQDLIAKATTAKAALDKVDSKTVTLGINVKFTGAGKAVYKTSTGESVTVARQLTFHGGGYTGNGSGELQATLRRGEYVLSPSAVSRYGLGVLDAMNTNGLPSARGGDTYHLTVTGGMDSAETIARRVQQSLLDMKRRQGVNLGLA